MTYDSRSFQKMQYTPKQLKSFWENALRDLRIAKEDDIPEVKFNYSYQALIKLGITVLARYGSIRARSVPGHPIKILEKMSEILKNEEIAVIGNVMRTKRNDDFYDGGIPITTKEAKEYCIFVEKIIKAVKEKV